MAAAPPSPLYVKVSPSHAERLETKLSVYFQSPKRSGGGECDVKVCDRDQGVYAVLFCSEEVKTRVKEHGNHLIEVGGSYLKINILPDSEELPTDVAEGPPAKDLMSPATNSLPPLNYALLQKDAEKWMPAENYTKNTLENFSKQIFLQVSATLNTDLFTNEERRQVTELCPALKIDLCTADHGIEKVSGDYSSIEKMHSQFERFLQFPSHHRKFPSHPVGQKSLQESNMENHQNRMEGDEDKLEESSRLVGQNSIEEPSAKNQQNGMENDVEKLEVPSAIFEYFSQAYKEEIDDLEQKFSVKITSKECGGGCTFIQFLSDGSPNLVEKAQQAFVSSFQRVAVNLTQERISFTDNIKLAKAMELITQWKKDKKLLVKREGMVLVLRGPTKEISAAKEHIQEKEQESLIKKAQASSPKSGFEIDADIYSVIEPLLMEEIEMIQMAYFVMFEKKTCLKSHKLRVLFKSKPYSYKDNSSEAYEKFSQVLKKILAKPREKLIPLSGDQKTKLDLFFAQLKKENPQVRMEKRKDGLLLCGLPGHVCSTEKHIMYFLQKEVNPSSGNVWGSLPGSSFGQTSQSTLEQKNGQEISSSAIKEQSNPKEEVKEEVCSICMDKVHQKKVLPKCKHEFCTECINMALKFKAVCPLCNVPCGKVEGNQPPGTMQIRRTQYPLPGYERCGTIEISYNIPSGIQTNEHPNPGKQFSGTYRTAYLPDNVEGNNVLKMLQQAFDQKLIFTVGQSRTTGATDVVTWNDIHHKTSMFGGPDCFGYPDPHYLKRVQDELKAKGIELQAFSSQPGEKLYQPRMQSFR